MIVSSGGIISDSGGLKLDQSGNLSIPGDFVCNNMSAGGGYINNLQVDSSLLMSGGSRITFIGGYANYELFLVAGTITVLNTYISSASILIITRKSVSGIPGNLSYTINPGVGFTINSSSITDASTLTVLVFESY